MRRKRFEYVGLLLATPLLLIATGCGEPDPDPDGVIMYIKKARVGDKVRRLWPEGHQYVTAVLKADSEYRKAVGGLLDLRTPKSLWKTHDDKWRDAEAVKKAAEALDEMLKDEAATKREEAFGALDEEIAKAPAGVDTYKVWDALLWRDEDVRQIGVQLPELLGLAQQHRALLALAQDHAGIFDKGEKKKGLSFTDAETQRAVLAAHAAIQAPIDAYQQKYRDYVVAGFEDAERRVTELQEEKERLKAAGQDGGAKRALEYRIDYQMARRKMFEKERKAFEKKEAKTEEG